MAKQKVQKNEDPFSYHGPIERADGVRPFNRHLWTMPGDDWWAGHELGSHINSRWHFGVVALADGRYSTSGTVWDIERGHDHQGRVCVFATRPEAIRMACARMIRVARSSRQWNAYGSGKLTGANLAQVINWARQIVAKETARQEPRPIRVREPEQPRVATGLPLFDFA